MNCDRSKALVSVYVDGELSEELAGPLRRHLMECAECRASVSEAKAMASWFVPSAAISVPEGFAARVARLATSGAGGVDRLAPSRASHETRLGAQGQLGSHALPALELGAQRQLRSVDRTARFAMSLAAVAAAVLIGLTLLLASDERRGFDGTMIQAQPPVEAALKALEELNRREADAAAGVAPMQSSPPAPAAPGAAGAEGSPRESEQPKSPK